MSAAKRTSVAAGLPADFPTSQTRRKTIHDDSDDTFFEADEVTQRETQYLTLDALPPDTTSLLRIESLDDDPLRQFAHFYDVRAQTKKGLAFMTLSTVGENGRPTARTVVLQGFDSEGFLFYTCQKSLKGQNIAQNPFAALVFWWPSMYLQTRVEGYVKIATKPESKFCCEKYPPNMCVMAKAFRQGTILTDRALFVDRVQKTWLEHPDHDIPAENWTAYKVIPDKIEFWNGATVEEISCRSAITQACCRY
ncbi:hypothetical protein SARC_12213 [Sphaeroforma arctica JP610]|uniref:pyridoxal 5'-phosphate synthase n=1 Tax=Sphaeroforma arctica JP610 TaxID=667725 RepID=A0A0L0FGT8_9EUKA|nr:hypothetical protein SARC_12213 [Sphaeroforma arctica JP610]KNC75258.1 hypothetical protein SARC_12213 [Sphaeroforma arctica JP610]|eukprot:XP_014149160.1 hypothetical protein SARC_12213 [Sphaeroforma arctica JP610]